MKKEFYKVSFKLRSMVLTGVLLLSGYTVFAQHDPEPVYKGKIGKTLDQTTEWYPEKKQAPKGSPNVIWLLLDDVGFGASSTFGGLISTPTFDSLANAGLRYTNFHTTGICAPSRAALLTGRNHHSVHMGSFTFTPAGTPGYDGRIPFETGTVAEILKENGYNTFSIGKWNLTPTAEETQAGPFNRWPTGRGFEHFYGFLEAETDEWHPQLWEDNQKIERDTNPKHLNELLIERTINYIANQKSSAPDKPFFIYLAPGATHDPHQAPKEWIDKYKGKFDGGWDKYRAAVFANQQKLGLIPKGTVLPPRDPRVKAWDSLSVDEKRIFSRFMEVYAGYLSYTDDQISHLIHYLKDIGQLDNTVIYVMVGDNGASKEGSDRGSSIGDKVIIDGKQDISYLLTQYDKLGSEYAASNYPLGWAQAANTPFREWKQDANSEGGTHNPLIFFYPNGIKDKGGIRFQYTHLIDLLPTTIDLTGAKLPDTINGYKQKPLQGTSFAYTIDDAKAPSKHTIQYYEIAGSRSIYKDGWKAAAYHNIGGDFDADVWELYHLDKDWTESKNLAVQNPAKLTQLRGEFDSLAVIYNIYPLKELMGKSNSLIPPVVHKKVVLYNGLSQLVTAPVNIAMQAFTATADVTIPQNGAQGVLFAGGGRFGGVSFFVQDNKLHFVQNDGVSTPIDIVSDKTLPTGKASLKAEFVRTSFFAQTGTLNLYINDEKVGSGQLKIKRSLLYFNLNDGFDVGKDSNTEVSPTYKVPFKFTGDLRSITLETTK
jgi:arylsulfatase A-like enzyme